LKWNPQGKRKVGRSAKTWRRSIEEETKKANISWNTAEKTGRALSHKGKVKENHDGTKASGTLLNKSPYTFLCRPLKRNNVK